jgi:protein tyrosine/serine phosphatase
MILKRKSLAALFVFMMLSFALASCSLTLPPEKIRPQDWAIALPNQQLDNFYKVDNKVYRSAQPSREAMQTVYNVGIRHILNLRYFHSDKDEAKNIDLTLHRVPMVAHNITYPELVRALRIIKQANAPVLVHCYHGSDRTGTVIAAYRIAFQGWSKQKAIHELKRGGYGFHHTLFPNIPELLEGLDVEKLREDVTKISKK